MDVYDFLSRLENITKSLQESSKERVKNDFNKSLGINKEQYESARKLIDSYQDSEDSISQYEKQIKQCDDNLKKFDETIKKLTDNLNKAKKPEDRDKIQNVIDNKKSERERTAQRRSRLEESLDRETNTKNRASSKFKRLTGGKDITQGVAAARVQNKAMKGLAKGRAGSAMKMLGGLKNNPYMAAVGLLVKAVEFGIGKATDYMKLNYENLLRQLNASTAVSLNAMKASIASWQDSVTGAYEAQNMAISSQETLLEAQNATGLANLKMANTWTNWIPIWGQINKYQETALELEQKIAQTRLENAHKTISQVNEFTRKTDEYIKKQDKAIRGFQTDRGMSSTQNAIFEKWMLGQGESFAKFNKTIEDVLKMQSSYTEQSGRAVNFSEHDNLQSIAVGRLVGDENLINFQSQMQLFNHSVSESADIMYEMYKDVNKMGLSQKKVTKDVLANLKLANKYDFKNGTKGFIELAKWAENARFNLSSLGNMIEKVQGGGMEGTITQAAKLQVLGGNFARNADPLSMMFNAYSDPDAYAKQIQSMFKGMGRVNKKTGETEFNREENILIRAAAEALGISTEDAKNMIREDNKKSVVKSQMRSSTLSKEQQDAVANKAQRDETTGRWYVNTINGGRIDISDDQKLKENLDNIVSDNKDEAAVQYAQSTLSFVEKIEATTKQIDAKLGRLSFDNFGETVNQSNRNTLDYYSKNIESVISAIQTDRKEAIKAQEEQLKKLATIGDDIVKALAIVAETKEQTEQKQKEAEIKIETIKAAEEKREGRWKNVEQSYQEGKNAGYFDNFSKGQDLSTARAKYYSALGDEQIEKGDYLSGAWNKLGAFSEQTIGRASQAIGNLFGASASGVDDFFHDGIIKSGIAPTTIAAGAIKNIHDGVASFAKSNSQNKFMSGNGRPMTVATNKVTPVHDGMASIIKSDSKDKVVSGNGRPMAVVTNKVTPVHDGTVSIAKSDPKDSAIFAKTGGPFDTLFNGIFDKINEIYGVYSDRINHDNVSPNLVVRPVPIAHDGVFPSPVSIDNTDSQNTHSQYNTQTNETQKGQFDVNVRGEINLKANGQSINILSELQSNPTLVRAITDLISDSISKKTNGGRAIPGGQKW